MRDSACRWFIVKKAKVLRSYVKEHLQYIFLLIIFLIIHLSVNTKISHIFYDFFPFLSFFCKKERLNTNLKTETQKKVGMK